VLLYGLWRYYAAHAGVAELTPLPIDEWNWSTLPATLRSIGKIVAESRSISAASPWPCEPAADAAAGVDGDDPPARVQAAASSSTISI
jgi:hypothetical protein